MKVAVCLHGYFGTLSTNDFSTSKGGHEHIHHRAGVDLPDSDGVGLTVRHPHRRTQRLH